MNVRLQIECGETKHQIDLVDEISIGRTSASKLALDDPGLSRINTTIFPDGDELLVTDENSTNGTFLNGERISGRPRIVRDGDQIKIGSLTTIRVSIEKGAAEITPSIRKTTPTIPARPKEEVKSKTPVQDSAETPWLLITALGLIAAIVLFGAGALYFLSDDSGSKTERVATGTKTSSRIPVRVIDPLGGEDEEDLDDLIASWETAEEEIDVAAIEDVAVTSGDKEDADLQVSASLLADRKSKANEPRSSETGIQPAGLVVPKALFGDGVIKQKAKLAAMNSGGYRQPMDFADLAEKRLNRELIELPMATESYYLDVGGSAKDSPFSSFNFSDNNKDILVGSPKYGVLKRLADNFSGKAYDLNNPADRKQMRVRLLRMFQPRAKPILQKLARAYFQKFNRPLRVTSLTRSMDYQILLNSNNANSFKVRGEGSLPPHTSGCAFDLARKHMTAAEQNFVMETLAAMEQAGELDALIEYGANACFHVFIYHDGKPPKM